MTDSDDHLVAARLSDLIGSPPYMMDTGVRSPFTERGGFEFMEGWYTIARDLGREVAALDERIRCSQAKEKFGELRVYWLLLGNSEDENERIREVGLGFLGEEKLKMLRDITERYVSLSTQTCECCGSPGMLRNLTWLKTLCHNHHELWKTGWRPWR